MKNKMFKKKNKNNISANNTSNNKNNNKKIDQPKDVIHKEDDLKIDNELYSSEDEEIEQSYDFYKHNNSCYISDNSESIKSLETEMNNISNKFDFDQEENEEVKLMKLRDYYSNQKNMDTNVENNVKKDDHMQHTHTHTNINSQYNKIICKICYNQNSSQSQTQTQDSFIILSCNHTFHIKCLAEFQFNDLYKFNIIDKDYFNTRKCNSCNKELETEELLFLHSKFLSNTKNSVENQDAIIKNLESKLKNLKDDLRKKYEYRNKLQNEREKSKEIVGMLTMMI